MERSPPKASQGARDTALWRAWLVSVVLFFKMRMGWKKEEVGSLLAFSLRGAGSGKNTGERCASHRTGSPTGIQNKKLGLFTIIVTQGS